MIILRNKTYSDEADTAQPQQKSNHTGAKIATGLGALGTAAAVLATKGKFGAGAQKFMGNTIGTVGKNLGSKSVANFGAKTAATGRISQVNSVLSSKGMGNLTADAEQKITNRALNRFAVPE